MWLLMSRKITSYDNNQVIVDKIKALRTCIDRRHFALLTKIRAGIACDPLQNVKLSLIAHLLIDYQKNAEDKKDKDCLQVTASARKGWKLINTFLDYIERECRDCLVAGTAVTSGDGGTSSSPTSVTLLITQDGDLFATQGGDNLKKR
jgi:hypothetical protein